MNTPVCVFRHRSRIIALACSAFLALIVAAACKKTPPPTIVTEAAGHAISAEIEGTPSVENQPDFAVISGPHGRVTIERERVRLDDLEWTTIPASVPVTVSIKRHKVRIRAGNVTIARTTSD